MAMALGPRVRAVAIGAVGTAGAIGAFGYANTFSTYGTGARGLRDRAAIRCEELPAAEKAEEPSSWWSQQLESLSGAMKDMPTLDSMMPDLGPVMPSWIDKLRREVNMAPGSVSNEIWQDAQNVEENPEIARTAHVRVSPDLCAEEQAFYEKRLAFTRQSLARYLDIPEDEVHEDDVPLVTLATSGGGLRALVGTVGYLRAFERDGLFDLVAYAAGVSGSCWALALYNTIGKQSWARVISHVKDRIGVHIASPRPLVESLTEEPTAKYLLTGIIERTNAGVNDVGIVDLYGTLLASRLLVPENLQELSYDTLKVSRQSELEALKQGLIPLPIYTMVHHVIPKVRESEHYVDIQELRSRLANRRPEAVDEQEQDDGKTSRRWMETSGSDNGDDVSLMKQELDEQEEESYFTWLELTPFEFGSEDFGAFIPTWSLGRTFDKGVSVEPHYPETRLSVLFGIFGSAMCATLSHYYREIRPALPKTGFIKHLDDLIMAKDTDMLNIHPLDPATLPNYVKNMGDQLPDTCPETLHTADNLAVMDAGMSNNLPFYPLLRRNPDIILTIDCSSDIMETPYFERAEGYARQRGIRAWPSGAGWTSNDTEQLANEMKATSAQQDETKSETPTAPQRKDTGNPEPDQAAHAEADHAETDETKYPLGPCTVWIGSVREREDSSDPPRASVVDEDWSHMQPDDGIALVYLPMIPNKKVPGLDMDKTPFLSTWNFEYTPEQVDSVVDLAEANYAECQERIRRVVRAAYEAKRERRLAGGRLAYVRKD